MQNAFSTPRGSQEICIGEICAGSDSKMSKGVFCIPHNDLAKHVLIVGSSQRDRTNTVLQLLQELQRAETPFLLIAPAEVEYRRLKKAQGFENIRVYQLGDERYAPFRLNPFEFEGSRVGSQSVTLQQHMDYLRQIFESSFGFKGILLEVLQSCIEQVYREHGWNPYNNENRRLANDTLTQLEQIRDKEHIEVLLDIFPTLTDLYNKIDSVVDTLVYKGDQTHERKAREEVKASIKSVVGRLRFGGKGAVLDTPLGISFSDLLRYPTILELHQIGDYEDAGFIISLLLIRLYEYCLTSRQPREQLEHMTFIENAHQFFSSMLYAGATDQFQEVVQGKIKLLIDIFSSLSSYGEGITLVKPAFKGLDPGILQLAHLKITDSLKEIGHSDLQQANTFKPGEVFALIEGQAQPEHLLIHDWQKLLETPITNDNIAEQDFLHADSYRMLCNVVRGEEIIDKVEKELAANITYSKSTREITDLNILDIIRQMADMSEFMSTMRRYFISSMMQPNQVVYGYPEIRYALDRFMSVYGHTSTLRDMDLRSVEERVLATVLKRIIDERGARYRWLYQDTTQLYKATLEAFLWVYWVWWDKTVEFPEQMWEKVSEIADKSSKLFYILSHFQEDREGPFAGCRDCKEKCLYRLDGEIAVHQQRFREEVEDAWKLKEREAVWMGLATAVYETAERHLIITDTIQDEVVNGLALCLAAQRAPRDVSGVSVQQRMVEKIVWRIPQVKESRQKRV